MIRSFLLSLLVLLTAGINGMLEAQSISIRGTVADSVSMESLIGVSVFDVGTSKGTITNNFGYFNLNLSPSTERKHKIIFSYVGYAPKTMEIDLRKDSVLQIRLKPGVELEEVTIYGERPKSGARSSQMSSNEVPIKMIQKIPVIFGETDILKAIQLLPGVQSGTEATSGLYVRGGGPDQNLVLLDGVPIYNVNHIMGFFSLFNADAIKNVTLYKGAFPAEFAGRLSSVVDIRMKDGDMQNFHGSASIGVIASRINLEGPLWKNRTSFNFSARRTYLDLISRPIIAAMNRKSDDGTTSNGGFYFYDINLKLNHIINRDNRLYFSLYSGDDALDTELKSDAQAGSGSSTNTMANNWMWGNLISALRWNTIIGRHAFLNTTLSFNRYRTRISAYNKGQDLTNDNGSNHQTAWDYNMSYNSGIQDLGLRTCLDYNPFPEHSLKIGADYLYHTFKPEVMGIRVNTGEDGAFSQEEANIHNSRIYAHELNLYAEDNMRLGDRINLGVGGNISTFTIDAKTYFSIEPRLSARYLLDRNISLKASYAIMSQYIHLLSNNTINMPTDLWVPCTKNIRPMHARQAALGLFYSTPSQIELSVEGYYKTMDHILEYKDGSTFFAFSEGWEDKVEQGNGRSYGIEFLAQKNYGKWSGWIAYTLAWADRIFPDGSINQGKRFPARYDRRHDISITANYQISKKTDLSASWVYASGNTATLPLEEHYGDIPSVENAYGSDTYTYAEHRNNYRMPSYHRLDLSINFHKKFSWGSRVLNLSVYNAYNRKNPFMLYTDKNELGQHKLYQLSLFPFIPSISYSIKF